MRAWTHFRRLWCCSSFYFPCFNSKVNILYLLVKSINHRVYSFPVAKGLITCHGHFHFEWRFSGWPENHEGHIYFFANFHPFTAYFASILSGHRNIIIIQTSRKCGWNPCFSFAKNCKKPFHLINCYISVRQKNVTKNIVIFVYEGLPNTISW